jgi:hypothetical protein
MYISHLANIGPVPFSPPSGSRRQGADWVRGRGQIGQDTGEQSSCLRQLGAENMATIVLDTSIILKGPGQKKASGTIFGQRNGEQRFLTPFFHLFCHALENARWNRQPGPLLPTYSAEEPEF